ncbi:hypothetical protein [Nitratireductor sp. XY-223]|uniref:hypothetical protein n=1 Tax=Nitratireductor sp. XY-223 TaxID=2561926 RepID=UPI0010AA0731|nr:hypothetical protein [Nitratireductor sp. XY-223]
MDIGRLCTITRLTQSDLNGMLLTCRAEFPGEVLELLERLFVEERRRLKIIPNAWGEKPVLKLMFAAMTRAAERWRPIRITEFERRQMAAVRTELDKEYEAQIGLGKPTSKEKPSGQISSTSRT